jgi:pyrroline-5-carboxylate reductase
MARALARGIVAAGVARAEQFVASDPAPAALASLMSDVPGARCAADNRTLVAMAPVVVLAVKPQQMPGVLAQLSGGLTDDHLVVSIAAGVPLSTIQQAIGPVGRLVRVMPNTPCLVGKGASGYCLGRGATEADGQFVGRLLAAVGAAFRVDEKLLDAVTGLSGSGPAFVYVMIEALSDGGVLAGLPRDVALALAAHTVRGAAEMVLASGEHPAVLKDRVTSPAGTTIAGLSVLEDAGLRAALIRAVEAAARRSRELGAAD